MEETIDLLKAIEKVTKTKILKKKIKFKIKEDPETSKKLKDNKLIIYSDKVSFKEIKSMVV